MINKRNNEMVNGYKFEIERLKEDIKAIRDRSN